MIGDGGSDELNGGPSGGTFERPRARVAVVTVWREPNAEGRIRGRLLTEVGPGPLGQSLVEYAEGVGEIAALVTRWLERFDEESDPT